MQTCLYMHACYVHVYFYAWLPRKDKTVRPDPGGGGWPDRSIIARRVRAGYAAEEWPKSKFLTIWTLTRNCFRVIMGGGGLGGVFWWKKEDEIVRDVMYSSG